MTGKSTTYKTCTGKAKAPICPYCGAVAVFHANSAKFYRGKDYGPLWACEPCKAWVGCHPGKDIPLGRLADAELRKAKSAAHAAFDPLWKAKLAKRRKERGPEYRTGFARGSGYKWLAQQMGIDRKDCHIGMFDVEQCNRVVEICAPYRRKAA